MTTAQGTTHGRNFAADRKPAAAVRRLSYDERAQDRVEVSRDAEQQLHVYFIALRRNAVEYRELGRGRRV